VAYVTYQHLGWFGRLGNQLFQIAGTIGLAHRHGMEPRLPSDWSYREWLSIPDELFDDVEGTEAYALSGLEHLPAQARPFLQDISLWKNEVELIHRFFAPSAAALEVLDSQPSDDRPRVAVHVRRGDFVDLADAYPVQPVDYYVSGVADYPDHVIEVFSDDVDWCVTNLVPAFEGRAVEVSRGTPRPKRWQPEYETAPNLDWVDLFLMARCEHHVIANSSFSWWGAFLGHDAEAIYPAMWFGPSYADLDPSLLIPEGWRAK